MIITLTKAQLEQLGRHFPKDHGDDNSWPYGWEEGCWYHPETGEVFCHVWVEEEEHFVLASLEGCEHLGFAETNIPLSQPRTKWKRVTKLS